MKRHVKKSSTKKSKRPVNNSHVYFIVVVSAILLVLIPFFSVLINNNTESNVSAQDTKFHYAALDNFDANGKFSLGRYGFNLSDAKNLSDVNNMPLGDKALVYIDACGGADTDFISRIQPYVGNPNIFGFSLLDESSPTGQNGNICQVQKLKEESDWIHANDPGAKTFIVLKSMFGSVNPSISGMINPAQSDIDLYGIVAYPCRSEFNGCNYSIIAEAVSAAESAGIPLSDIIPVYQAFGGGNLSDGQGGTYLLPTAGQELRIINTWQNLVPNPAFDYTYSWGSQYQDISLSESSVLRVLFSTEFNSSF
jgi:hypothetical protein